MAWYSGMVFPRLSTSPWISDDVTRWYGQDVAWLYHHEDQGGSFTGTRAKKVRKHKETQRGTRAKVANPTHPELAWIETNPPVKDENGIPIPEERSYYGGGTVAEYMVINGRKMCWDGTKHVPMPVVRITTPRWRKPGPVDLKIQHGPHLPKARTKAHSLTERIQSLQGPVISLDLRGATPTESADLLDLLEAINA
jgi:hypothetical protein